MDDNVFFNPLRQQRLSEEVYNRLKDAILEGFYKPGDKLPSEKAFCELFKVGRPVVREALRFLENSGLIYVKPGARGGAFVKKIDSSILSDTFEGIVKLDGISMDELAEARLVLELATLPLILERLKEEDIKALEDNLEEVRQNLEKGVRAKRNLTFHVVLVKASGNKLLIKIAEALFDLMGRLLDQYEYSVDRSRKVMEEHISLLNAIKAKDYEKAKFLMSKHIEDTRLAFKIEKNLTDYEKREV